jgi:hypothetical protein
MSLKLVWTMPAPRIRLVWYGPAGAPGNGPPVSPARPVVAIIGQPGPAGADGIQIADDILDFIANLDGSLNQ